VAFLVLAPKQPLPVLPAAADCFALQSYKCRVDGGGFFDASSVTQKYRRV
jgi:hypothetical protein